MAIGSMSDPRLGQQSPGQFPFGIMAQSQEQTLQLTYEEVLQVCKQVDQRGDANIQLRRGSDLERKWLDMVGAGIQGQVLRQAVYNTIQNYIPLGDSTFPYLLRLQVAQDMAWMNQPDWLELTPNGFLYTDTVRSNWLAQSIMQNLEDDESNFRRTMTLAFIQARLMNLTGIHQCWYRKVKNNYKQTIEYNDGYMQVRMHRGPAVLEKEYPQFELLNIFNTYPDVFSARYDDLNKVDTHGRKPVALQTLKMDERFNENIPFPYPDLVLFRSNKGLNIVRNPTYTLSIAERELQLQGLAYQSGQNSGGVLKDYMEVRTCYLEYLKLPASNSMRQDVLYNVILIYAKSNDSNVVPLLLMHNPYDFCDKEIKLWQDSPTPYSPFGYSSLQTSFNDYSYMTYMKGIYAYTAGKTIMDTKFYPIQLLDAKVKASEKQLLDALHRPGSEIWYDQDKYDLGANGIWQPTEKVAARDLQISSQAMQVANASIQNANQSLQAIPTAQSTATGISSYNNDRDLIQKQKTFTFVESVLKPIIRKIIKDKQTFLQSENVSKPLNEDRLKQLAQEFDTDAGRFIQIAPQVFASIDLAGEGVQTPLFVIYDLNNKTESTKLSSQLISDLETAIKIKIQGNDFSKYEEAQNMGQFYGQMFGMLADVPAPAKIALAKVSIDHMGDIYNNPKLKDIDDIVDKVMEQLSQPDPNEQTKNETAMVTAQANAQEKQARAQHLQADAQLKGQEAQANEMLLNQANQMPNGTPMSSQ